jgi:hypothetical protein
MIFGLCSDHVDLLPNLKIISWGSRWTLLFSLFVEGLGYLLYVGGF